MVSIYPGARTVYNAVVAEATIAAIDSLFGSSVTARTIPTSFPQSLSFTTQENKAFKVGRMIILRSRGSDAWLYGQVTAYSGRALTVSVVEANGAGSYSDWDITVSGVPGVDGEGGSGGGSMDANSILTAIKTVDGSGSGLDADLLDGSHAAAFALAIHSHIPTDITGFAESVDDRVAALLLAGANVTLTYDDAANTLTIASSGGGGGLTNEDVDDRVAALLQAGSNITLTYNDGANTLTVDAAGGSGGTLASQVDAETGTDNTKYTSSLRTHQAIKAQSVRPITTRAVAISTTVPSGVTMILTTGYATAGDGGHGLYKRISTPSPVMAGAHFQSADGQYWELVLPPEGVNVRQFGTKGDGTTDDTAAIQAAIDFALHFSHREVTIHVPSGVYYVTDTIWLDPPGNMRVSGLASPTQGNFSIALVGHGVPFETSTGSLLYVANRDRPAVVVGPGNGMEVKGLVVRYAGDWYTPAPRKANVNGVGITFAGGNAATQTLVENCMVLGFYRGFSNGQYNDQLGDSNTYRKCYARQCYIGYDVISTQAYVNLFEACSSDSCTTAIRCPFKNATVIGGNFSHNRGHANSLTVSSISTMTAWNDTVSTPHAYRHRFTATVTSDDTDLVNGWMQLGCFKTTEHGFIPVEIESYNSSTHVITFSTTVDWASYMFGVNDDGTNITSWTNIVTVIRAQTTLYAAEGCTVFHGSGIVSFGTFVEQSSQNVPTCFVNAEGFGAAQHVSPYFDYNPSNWNSPQVAAFYIQQCHAFVKATNSDVKLDGIGSTGDQAYSVMMYAVQQNVIEFRSWAGPAPYVRKIAADGLGGMEGFEDTYAGTGIGTGRSDKDMWLPYPGVNSLPVKSRLYGVSQTPTIGNHPAPYVVPRLSPANIASIEDPATVLNDAPHISGQSLYQIGSWDSGRQRYALAKHAGSFRTYGQNMTNTWTYTGGSRVVRMANVLRMFPGLKIILNNGSGDNEYVVQEVYIDPFNFVVVQRVNSGYFATPMGGVGTVGTDYTAATVKQEPYKLVKYGRQAEFATALSDLVGRTYAVGEIVWKTNVASSGSPGWMCTTAGTVAIGSGAKFAPLPACGPEVFA